MVLLTRILTTDFNRLRDMLQENEGVISFVPGRKYITCRELSHARWISVRLKNSH